MKLKMISLAVITIAAFGIFISCTKKTNDLAPAHTTLDASGTSLNATANLGRVMFYDTHLSVNNSISCASCHKQANAFADNVAISPGFENKSGTRNALPIQGLTNFSILFWDGRDSSLSSMVFMPVLNHVEMGMSDINALVNRVSSESYYADLFTSAFGDQTVSAERISEALSNFVSSINSTGSRFDMFMQGQGTLNSLETQGMNLFVSKYNCNGCHRVDAINGYDNTAEFANIGLDVNYADNGLGIITKQPSDNGKFKVPNLKNVALTAPYMHDGRFATLNDVLDHYSHGIANNSNLDPLLRSVNGQPLQMNIPDNDKTAIIAFLNALTDYSAVTNSDFASPFKN